MKPLLTDKFEIMFLIWSSEALRTSDTGAQSR